MNLDEALRHLGATRVIWIDDHFSESPEQLGKMFAANIEATRRCAFPELAEVVERDDYSPSSTETDIVAVLVELGPGRLAEMRDAFFKEERAVEGASAPEMVTGAIEEACKLLAIAPEDRWTFEGVERRVRDMVAQYPAGDDGVSYVIDLKDNRTLEDRRGVAILRVLQHEGSRSTAFVLTHEVATDKEANLEGELMDGLTVDGVPPFPFSVISKGRLAHGADGAGLMEEAFRVAIKRAGLRRSLHEVLRIAEPRVTESFRDARRRLLRIAPEELDAYVVEKGHKEGLSELHVIERALTAFIARDVRKLFGQDAGIRRSCERMRALHGIPLATGGVGPDENLLVFREAETWEGAELVNGAFSPLACGDVFEVDIQECGVKSTKAGRFVLLGQPCDIQIRENGKRSARTGILAPIKPAPLQSVKAQRDKLMEHPLKIKLDGSPAICDLRDATSTLLDILDLATFRSDGKVRFDKGQEPNPSFLPGQSANFVKRATWIRALIEAEQAHLASAASVSAVEGEKRAKAPSKGAETHHEVMDPKNSKRLQMAFAAPDSFKYVESGILVSTTHDAADPGPPSISRVTWRLRRVGRIRMPYASDILDRYVALVSRNAFDADFTEETASKVSTLSTTEADGAGQQGM